MREEVQTSNLLRIVSWRAIISKHINIILLYLQRLVARVGTEERGGCWVPI